MSNRTVGVKAVSIMATALLGPVTKAEGCKIVAQQVVEEIKTAHPEIRSLEVAANRSLKGGCETIAATEAKELGQKCDKDELTAIKRNRPFIEREKGEFDATLPIHDANGTVIGTAGMDFKADSGVKKAVVERRAKSIVSEIEKRLTSRDQLFKPAQ